MKVFGYYQYFVPPIVSAVAKYIHILILKIMVKISTLLYTPLGSIINLFFIQKKKTRHMQRGTTTEAEAAVVEIEIEERERKKITLATEGFTPSIRRFESILRDRSELSRENALTISDYIIAMKREINPRLNTIRTTIQFLAELSKTVGIDKKFNDMMATNEDVLLYLDSCRMG